MLHFIKSKIVIPKEMINWRMSRASGPGGQNINKSMSKVELFYYKNIKNSFLKGIPPTLYNSLPSLISIKSELYREQEKNKEDCLRKLELLLKSYALKCAEPKIKSDEDIERYSRLKEKGKTMMMEEKIRFSSLKNGRRSVKEEGEE